MDKTVIAPEEAQALKAILEGKTQLLFETRLGFTHLFQALQLIGALAIFIVISSVLGLSSGSGKTAPEMSGYAAMLGSTFGITSIAVGLGLQSICKYYSVLDLRQKRIFSQIRLFNKVVRQKALISFSQIVSVGINRRSAGISTDLIKNHLATLVINEPHEEIANIMRTDDASLVVLSRNAKICEITSFRNGEQLFRLAKIRGEFLAELLSLPLVVCSLGYALESEKIANRLSLKPVSRKEQAMRPQNLIKTVLFWSTLILFLIVFFVWLISLTKT